MPLRAMPKREKQAQKSKVEDEGKTDIEQEKENGGGWMCEFLLGLKQ